jgi:hypothetical protein
MVYKHCACSCGHGYLRKDLDWIPPREEVTDIARIFKVKGRGQGRLYIISRDYLRFKANGGARSNPKETTTGM